MHVVPGNHDVRRERNAAVAALHQKIRADAALDSCLMEPTSRKLLRRKLAAYLAFRSALYGAGSPRGGELDWVLRLPFAGRADGIAVVGLNSVWVSDEADGGQGNAASLLPNMLLSREALDTGFASLCDRDLAIVLSHHPMSWLDEGSKALLQQYSTRAACIHLSGHCHRSLSEQRRRFGQAGRLVCMAAGASHAGLGEQVTNKYAWGALRYDTAIGRWEVGSAVREYFPERDAFVSSLGFDTADGFLWEPLEVSWVPAKAAPSGAAARQVSSGVD